MPYNGSGTFQRTQNWAADAAAGIKIITTHHDSEDDNFAAGLSQVITRDGQSPPTANLPMGGFRHTGAMNPVNPQDYATKASSEAIRNFSTGITIGAGGATLSGVSTGVAPNQVSTALVSFTEADMSLVGRNSGSPAGSVKRLAFNDKADGTGKDVFVIPEANVAVVAECYLDWSGLNLLLSRVNGKRLTINGVAEEIPAAGVTLVATGLTYAGGIGGNGAYYIYAYMSAATPAVMTLEASTTAYAADANSGMRVKTGDATRTFVGMAVLLSDNNWDTANRCCSISQFNPKPKTAQATVTSLATTSTSFVELSGAMRLPFVNLNDRFADVTFTCRTFGNGTANQDCWVDLRINSVSIVPTAMAFFGGRVPALGTTYPLAERLPAGPAGAMSETRNVLFVYGSVSGGSGSWVTAVTFITIWG